MQQVGQSPLTIYRKSRSNRGSKGGWCLLLYMFRNRELLFEVDIKAIEIILLAFNERIKPS